VGVESGNGSIFEDSALERRVRELEENVRVKNRQIHR